MIKINRAPVLTLWAAVVAERLGFDHDEALTLGRAVAGLSAQAKGRRLGIFEPSPENLDQKRKEHGPDANFAFALADAFRRAERQLLSEVGAGVPYPHRRRRHI